MRVRAVRGVRGVRGVPRVLSMFMSNMVVLSVPAAV